MVPKRSNLLEDSPSTSSSEEEEETSGQEEEEGDEEEEGKDGTSQESESESESDSGSDSDSDSRSRSRSRSTSTSTSTSTPATDSDTDPYGKPTASKPIDCKIGNAQSYNASTPKSEAAAAAKRKAETKGDAKDAKRVKLEDGKKLFQRLWSEEDEVTVLNGLIEFAEKRRIDPTKDLVAFLDFIKKDLSIKVQCWQVKDKVWRLKKKFENIVKKAKGEEKTFGKEHDQKVFDLSKMIWGREGIIGRGSEAGSVVKSDGNCKVIDKRLVGEKKGKNVGVGMEVGGLGKFDWTGGVEEHVLRKGMESLDGSTKDEMKEKLWKLHLDELELFIKKNELVRKHAEIVLAAYNKIDGD